MTRLSVSFAALAASAALAAPAAADVTPEEAWTVYEDLIRAYGMDVTSTSSRTGDILAIEDITVTLPIPAEFATVSIGTGPIDIADDGDGTLTVAYPNDMTLDLVADFSPLGGERFEASVDMSLDGLDIGISGTPEALVIESTADGFSMTLGSVNVPTDPELTAMIASAADMSMTFGPYSTSTTLDRADGLFTMEGTSSIEGMTYQGRIDIPEEDFVSTFSGSTESSESTMSQVVPEAGIDYTNLAAALRDGLAFTVATTTTGTTSRNISTVEEMETEQSSSVGRNTATFTFDATGLHTSGEAADMAMTYSMPPLMPAPVELSASSATFAMDLPVLATGKAQQARLAIGLDGLALSDQIWRMFDPSGLLPRDPSSLDVDIEAQVTLLHDFLDFMTMARVMDEGGMPAELESVTINALDLSVAGAALESSGSFTFDFSDMTTFGGMPRPEGSATATLSGANALIDTLIEMGLISDEDAMGARMGMGMFAESVGEDMLRTEIEVTDEAQVIVNGQRIR